MFGIYLIVYLYIGKLKFEILKKKMTEEEKESYIFNYARRCSRIILKGTGCTVNVIGEENVPEGNCLFVHNHQEYFDVLIMIGYINKPKGFIAKKELEKIPAVSYWMKQIHCVFMDREDSRESVKSILQGVDLLKSGYSMSIAPEGTRSKGPNMGEFKKGSMKLATKAGVPVVPVALNNVYKLTNGKGFLHIKPTKMDIIICKPIDTKTMSREEQNNLSEIVKAEIQKSLDAINKQ
jgi:1-acyl-sn-glycerol-3-phosphate acyltransferase